MATPAIQYACSADGTNIGCSVLGEGPSMMSVPSVGVTIGGRGMQVAALFNDFRRGTYDRRGTGSSGRGGSATDDLLVQDCCAVVDHLGFKSFHVFANRLGQFEAVRLALAMPDRVRGLILNSPFQRDWVTTPRAQAWWAAMNRDWDWFAEAFVRSWGNLSPGQPQSAQLVDHFKQTNDPEGFRAIFRILGDWDISEDLKRLRVPVLIIHKAGSPFPHPLEVAKSFATSIPGAQLIIDHGPDLIPLSSETEGSLREFFINTIPPKEVPVSWRLGEVRSRLVAAASGLSDREQEVLKLVAGGLSNGQIAEALFLAPSTVASHLRHILDKLAVENRAAAAAWAVREGLAK